MLFNCTIEGIICILLDNTHLIAYSLIFICILKAMMELYEYAMAVNSNFYAHSSDSDQFNENKDDFPQNEEPLWLLGRKYSTLHELEDLRRDFKSRIWITYRKNFLPIGGIGPTSDTGWGCMLRCGQMVLAQALVNMHLTRDWRWESNASLESDLQYREVLKLFQDKKDSTYSIHQIAQMGVAEGKNVGQWFGPNTVAQVLKKLSAYDKFNKFVVHVALDNIVVIDDIKSQCKEQPQPTSSSSQEKGKEEEEEEKEKEETRTWKPLILFIPLRLGLSEINPIYFKSLQTTFTLRQSLGIIGGRPNHALYFIGVVGGELIYLDPHNTQLSVDLDDENSCDDTSFHCERAMRMDISLMDPSISLCFYCHTEADFNNWCKLTSKLLINEEKQPLFELTKERPPHWPQLEKAEDVLCMTPNAVGQEAFTLLDDSKVSDDEFELLG